MILVMGNRKDPHVRAVLARLSEMSCGHVLLDAYEQGSGGFSHPLAEGVALALGREEAKLSSVTAVWWRQKAKPQVPAGAVLDLYNYNFVQREWNTIFDYVAAKTAHVFSMNDRQRAKLAENKAFQLEVAGGFQLQAPKTIITNRPDEAVRFFKEAGVRRCVYKSFSPYMPPNATMAYTTELDIVELCCGEFQETTDATPGIFQELIEADHEIRVTVVGDELFSARIDTPADVSGVDWRVSLFKNRYSHVTLPAALEANLLRYHAHLGLVFAAYDFIVTKNGDIFFLEVNPSGQWMWLEEQLGLPISGAIADALKRA